MKVFFFIKELFPNGFVIKQEFENLFNDVQEENSPSKMDKFVDFIFRIFDSDKSGTVTYHEFAKAMGFRLRESATDAERQAHFENFFNVFDQNGDGKVSTAELEVFFDAILEVNEKGQSTELVKQLFSKYDRDESGFLDKEEFVNFFLEEDILTLFLL